MQRSSIIQEEIGALGHRIAVLNGSSKSMQDGFSIGKALARIKEEVGHGFFTDELNAAGISVRTAQRFMAVCARFSDLTLPKLMSKITSMSTAYELRILSDDELLSLELGNTVRGLTLADLPSMSCRALSRALRSGLQTEPCIAKSESPDGMMAATAVESEQPWPPAQERQREYCRRLCKVLVRYATQAEIEALQTLLEQQQAAVTRSRYVPGLNDAAYHLYALLRLKDVQGGEREV